MAFSRGRIARSAFQSHVILLFFVTAAGALRVSVPFSQRAAIARTPVVLASADVAAMAAEEPKPGAIDWGDVRLQL
jgi:hypothetical protein